MDIISGAARGQIRDVAVRCLGLSQIHDVFGSTDHDAGDIWVETGSFEVRARHELVQSYLVRYDWRSWAAVKRALPAIEAILMHGQDLEGRREESLGVALAVRLLERDGFRWDGQRLHPTTSSVIQLTNINPKVFDTAVIDDHFGRIRAAVDTDPSLAIGSAKELVESVAKTVLLRCGQTSDKDASLLSLTTAALEALGLHAKQVPNENRLAAHARKVLGSLQQIVVGLGDLRNDHGTGHGRAKRSDGLRSRHALLAVNAASTLCQFLALTLEERESGSPAGAGETSSDASRSG